ncbi:MAG: glycosyltransferase, partial [Alphaproteobacteria bacterium]
RRSRLLLIGEGPQHTAVRRRAAALGIAKAVLMPGSVPHAELPNWTARFDIAVVPDIADYASPMKLFEYWASGAAVVAAATEPIRELMPEGYDGEAAVLIPPADRKALGNALAGLIADERRRRQIAECGRRLIEKEYNWDHHARRLLARLVAQMPSVAQTDEGAAMMVKKQ